LDKEGHDYFFHNPTPEIEQLINSLKKITNEEHKLRSVHKLDMEDRFLCKIALGFGFKFLGDDFLNSNYAMELQKALWEKDPCKRRQYKIHGTGFMHEKNIVDDILSWEGGHVLLFKINNGKLSLALSIFGKFGGYILISDEPALLKNMKLPIDEEGSVFIIIPQRDICIGPISLPSYISHKVGNIKIEQLSKIESLKIDISKLPPCQ